jgi:hypothetical protein
MSQPRRHIALLALLVGAVHLPAAARAQTAAAGVTATAIDEAEQYAEDAFNAYAHQDFRRAIALYEMALAAAPSADILYNIARVYDLGLNDTPNAIAYYRKYIAHSRARRPRSELAQQRIRELSGDDAAPQVVPGGAAPDAAAGTPGAGPFETATLAGPARHEAADMDVASTWTTSELTAAALTGAGAVALSVGIGFGVSAYAERDTWRSMCNGNSCTSQSAVDAARSASRKADVATVALVGGGGLLAIAAGFWWLAPDAAPAGTALRLSPASAGADLGCTLSGSF